MQRRLAAAWLPLGMLLLVLLPACGQGDGSGAPAPSTSPSAATSATATTTASASNSSGAASHPYAGRWKGSYKARRAKVSLPDRVSDKSWEDDSGEELAGEGDIELRVDATGEVSGSSKGALGKLHVRGLIDKNTLRAGLTAAEADQPGGIRGVLVGTGDAKQIDALLKVSSHDGKLARESRVVLTRAAE